MAEFHENWYSEMQLSELAKLVEQVRDLPGALIEVGCWEGRSTVRIAASCTPAPLHAIDHWLGNVDEGQNHPSVVAVAKRDVYGTFLQNVAPFPNVIAHKASGEDVLSTWDAPIKFAHVDSGHTYDSTYRIVKLILPHVVPGGIVCGDDYLEAHIGRRDLGGGVQRAVGELLPYHSVVGNFWYWRNSGVRHSLTITL
jgi:hypothetical protein